MLFGEGAALHFFRHVQRRNPLCFPVIDARNISQSKWPPRRPQAVQVLISRGPPPCRPACQPDSALIGDSGAEKAWGHHPQTALNFLHVAAVLWQKWQMNTTHSLFPVFSFLFFFSTAEVCSTTTATAWRGMLTEWRFLVACHAGYQLCCCGVVYEKFEPWLYHVDLRNSYNWCISDQTIRLEKSFAPNVTSLIY